MDISQLVLDLYKIQAVKFGSFTLKSGVQSPIYLDLRLVVSYPQILKNISDMLWSKIKNLSFELICGVPYTALPIATCLSVTHNLPMILRRKEAKDYGTKKIIEGVFRPGQTCLIIEDVVTSGSSILETIEPLSKEGLITNNIALVIDREHGGKERLELQGLQLHALMTISNLLHILYREEKIDKSTIDNVFAFLEIQHLSKK